VIFPWGQDQCGRATVAHAAGSNNVLQSNSLILFDGIVSTGKASQPGIRLLNDSVIAIESEQSQQLIQKSLIQLKSI
jgi:hypothetical protein